MEIKTITELEEEGFYGTDASLAESIFQYGLIWKEIVEDAYLFYYVVQHNDAWVLVEDATLPKDIDLVDAFNWIEDWTGVCSFVGMSFNEFIDRDLPYIVEDLLGYFGHENVFGGTYSHPQIKIIR